MLKSIISNNSKIFYDVSGKGLPIVLVHGFLEDRKIWGDFAAKLAAKNKVIAIDLFGHGDSELNNTEYTMCKYAENIKDVLEAEKEKKCFLIGHSMGGYISLAFAENYPDKLKALCLFHSVPFADSEEKKLTRNLAISQILKGKKEKLIKEHVPKIFANQNISKFINEIKRNTETAIKQADNSIIASIRAMKNRTDRTKILENLNIPFLFILGKSDNFISFSILEKIKLPKKSDINILANSGHAGFIEEKSKSIQIISEFITNYYL